MKRIYQLGEETILENSEKINAVLRARDGIIELMGRDTWKKIYIGICNGMRDSIGMPYLMAIAPCLDVEHHDVIQIIVFEAIAKQDDYYDIIYDKEKDLWYIEIEEQEAS